MSSRTATRSPSGPSACSSSRCAIERSRARAALSSRPVPDQDLLYKPATELADLVRLGEVSARDLTELALDRIEADQQGLNAFTVVDREGALAVADAIGAGGERPLAGGAVAIKDLSGATAGAPGAGGSGPSGGGTPPRTPRL